MRRWSLDITFIILFELSRRRLEVDNSVTFVGFANGSQSEHNVFNDSPKRIGKTNDR